MRLYFQLCRDRAGGLLRRSLSSDEEVFFDRTIAWNCGRSDSASLSAEMSQLHPSYSPLRMLRVENNILVSRVVSSVRHRCEGACLVKQRLRAIALRGRVVELRSWYFCCAGLCANAIGLTHLFPGASDAGSPMVSRTMKIRPLGQLNYGNKVEHTVMTLVIHAWAHPHSVHSTWFIDSSQSIRNALLVDFWKVSI